MCIQYRAVVTYTPSVAVAARSCLCLVVRLCELVVKSEADVLTLIEQGGAVRKVASTNMNERSSRSHSCFTIKVLKYLPRSRTAPGIVPPVIWQAQWYLPSCCQRGTPASSGWRRYRRRRIKVSNYALVLERISLSEGGVVVLIWCTILAPQR